MDKIWDCSFTAIGLPPQREYCGLRDRTDYTLVFGDSSYLALANGQSFSSSHDASFGDESLSLRRRDEVEFVFHCEHGRVLWHQGESGIPACAVGYRTRDSGVKKTMLLSERFRIGYSYFTKARFKSDNLRSKVTHEPLPFKTFMHSLTVFGVFNFPHLGRSL